MIKDIIDLLTLEEYYGISRRVDVAKGKYIIPYSWTQGWKQIKRIYHGR
jgi:hypothetical protein